MRANEVIPLETDLGRDAARVLEVQAAVELEVEVTKYLEPFRVVGRSAKTNGATHCFRRVVDDPLLSHDQPPERVPASDTSRSA